jgi:hypothetical protein
MTTNSYRFTNDRAFENAYLVYIQGIEVPVQAASVHHEVGSLPVVTLQMAPDPQLARLGMEDRVEVQIFYKDNFFSTVKGTNPEFCVLFDGTIDGWSYSHNAFGRNITFQVSHSSRILQETSMFFFSGIDSSVAAAATPEGQSSSASGVISPLAYPWSLLFRGFGMGNTRAMSRPFDMVDSFFRASLDVETDPTKVNNSIINAAFLVNLLHRRGLRYQFIPSPILEFEKVDDQKYHVFPLMGMSRAQAVISAIGHSVERLGYNVNVWDIFLHVYSQMYYEIGTIMAPPIAQVDLTLPTAVVTSDATGVDTASEDAPGATATVDTKSSKNNIGAVLGMPKWKLWKDGTEIPNTEQPPEDHSWSPWLDDKKPNFLINHVTKPQWMFGIAPACNVVFPSMIEEVSFSESYSAQPTRCYVDGTELFDLFSTDNPVMKALGKIRGAYPPLADEKLQSKSRDHRISAKNLLVWPAEFFRGPQSVSIKAPRIIGLVKEDAISNASPEQLMAQYVLDTLHSKEQSIAELAMSQARAEVGSNTDGIESKRKEIFAKLSENLWSGLTVLVKELVTANILPPGKAYTSLAEVQKDLVAKTAGDTTDAFTMVRRFAQYEYFRQGSGARAGQVNMPFNPYIVAGFPIVIFNSHEDGNHFVGYVVGIDHQLTTSSMRTSVSFIMGQTLDEYLQNIFDARIGNNQDNQISDISAAPVHPFNVLRDVMQVQEQAEIYFSKVLHQATKYTTPVDPKVKKTAAKPTKQVKTAAFDIFRAVKFRIAGDAKSYSMDDVLNDDGFVQFKRKMEKTINQLRADFEKDLVKQLTSLEETDYKKSSDAIIEERLAQQTALEEQYRVTSIATFMKKPRVNPKNKILDSYTSLGPSDEFAPMCASYESAMRYVSRPVCTLDEYIKFRGSWGWARNPVSAVDEKQGKGAPYYERILNFKEGPGDPPTIDPTTGIPINPLPKDLPETRLPWIQRLLNYRNRFLYGTVPDDTEQT